MILGLLFASFSLLSGVTAEADVLSTDVDVSGASGSAKMTWYESYPRCCCKNNLSLSLPQWN